MISNPRTPASRGTFWLLRESIGHQQLVNLSDPIVLQASASSLSGMASSDELAPKELPVVPLGNGELTARSAPVRSISDIGPLTRPAIALTRQFARSTIRWP